MSDFKFGVDRPSDLHENPGLSPAICSQKCSNRQTIDGKGLLGIDCRLLLLLNELLYEYLHGETFRLKAR